MNQVFLKSYIHIILDSFEKFFIEGITSKYANQNKIILIKVYKHLVFKNYIKGIFRYYYK